MIRLFFSLITALTVLSFSPFQREVPENKKGIEKYEHQRYEEAEEEFRKGSERRSTDAEIAYNLGAALFKKGDLEEARKAWESALTKNPTTETRARIYDGLGAVAAAKQQYREAEQFFERSLRTRPDRDTAANLEIVRRLLKHQEEQKEQQQQQQQEEKQQQEQLQEQQRQEQGQQKKEEEKKEEAQQPHEKEQQAAQSMKEERGKKEEGQKDKAEILAPFRKRKDLQVSPFMLERQGDPQGGQVW